MKKIIFIFLIVFIQSGLTAGLDVPIMPLTDIKPGMEGIGKTVYYGQQVEEFGVKVLEIIQNFYPKYNLILVRLTGEKAEHAGVVSGMSGSPIYIDNKLIGALSMRLGQFMKEPIAAITPIEYMLKVSESESHRSEESKYSSIYFEKYIENYFCGTSKGFWKEMLAPFQVSAANSYELEYIRSPLVFSGFSKNTLDPFRDIFKSLGFVMVQGGSNIKNSEITGVGFEPGSAISQIYVGGDVGIDATGTVTAVYANKVLAFGHQVFNLGPINIPLAHAKILATLPSMMGSNKLALSTKLAGSFRQDRMAGVYGDLSLEPSLIPVRVNLRSTVFENNQYHFDLAQDPSMNNLIPFFFRIAVFQAIVATRLSSEQVTSRIETRFSFKDKSAVSVKDFYSTRRSFGVLETGTDAAGIGDLVASMLGAIWVNDYKTPAIKSIDLDIKTTPGESVAKIQAIRQDKIEIDPGDSLFLDITLRNTKGEDLNFDKIIPIPERLSSRAITVLVSSASSLTRYEMSINPHKYRPYDFDQLLGILSEKRQNNYLYIQVRVPDGGMVIKGSELTDLPPSVLSVMDSKRSTGLTRKLRDQVLAEYKIPTEYMILGAKRLFVRLNQPQQATLPEPDGKEENNAYIMDEHDFWKNVD